MNRTKTQKIALYGLFIALAMILSFVESQIPAFFTIPGMKLGLTNIVVLISLYVIDEKSAITINLIRILLVSLSFGNAASFMYSFAGGLLSVTVMIFMKRCKKIGIVSVSIAGGITHNLGQIIMAMIILRTTGILTYFIALYFAGLAAGAVIGFVGGEICKRFSGRKYEAIN